MEGSNNLNNSNRLNLKEIISRIERSAYSGDIAEVILEAVCAACGSAALWWSRTDTGSRIWFYSGGKLREIPYAAASQLEILEPRAAVPVAREDMSLNIAGCRIARILVAPYERNGLRSWIAAANKDAPYTQEDALALADIAALASMALTVYVGNKRIVYARIWEHYLRTPLWTLSLALEDIRRKHSEGDEINIASAASRVISSQLGAFLCDMDIENQRMNTFLPLKDALVTINKLGKAWGDLERRKFEIFTDIDDPALSEGALKRIKYGSLQMLLTAINAYFADRHANGVCMDLSLKNDAKELLIMIEAQDFGVIERGRLHHVLLSIARRYAVSFKANDTVSGEAIEAVIPLYEPSQAKTTTLKKQMQAPHVVVVDDSAVNRDSLAGMLRAMGIPVITAKDGLDAVELLTENSSVSPDLIFMDILMPRMDGIEATKALRKNGIKCPIMAFTAGGVSDITAALEAGMDETLFKPVSWKLLVDVVEQWTGFIPPNSGKEHELSALKAARDEFLKELPYFCARLVTAIGQSDGEEIINITHRLKGDAAQSGFAQFAAFMEELAALHASGGDLRAAQAVLASSDPLASIQSLN